MWHVWPRIAYTVAPFSYTISKECSELPAAADNVTIINYNYIYAFDIIDGK